ncbi:MAG: hypothetical protein CM15mP117_20020 [Alphaproteobacteria bacterium]|nr:MAG: hypothetical protein CM15mP117_20020 [Alphaproteobacteria bacterium]
MPAYWLARAKINDPIAYKRYTDQVPKIIGAHGGKVLGRGGKFKILEGPEKFERFVVIEFPSLEAAEKSWAFDEYQNAASTGRMGLVKTN